MRRMESVTLSYTFIAVKTKTPVAAAAPKPVADDAPKARL
jgi:cytochrome c oxidase assembly protein Cox11